MTLTAEGKLIIKYDTIQVSEKFKKREFVIEIEEEVNGNVYTNFAKFQCVQSRCDILDRWTPGDMLKVHFNLKGNSYTDKKDGATKYITNLDAWKVEGTAQTYTPLPAANNYNAGTPSFNPSPETIDDLPF